jgi:hypothetical protein
MTRQRIAMLIGCSLCLWLEAPVLDATELVREEPIPIQTIIADPQAFNMRKVRLQGTIRTLERIPRVCGLLGEVDAYLFILDDQTGQLPISDRGRCPYKLVKPLMAGFAVGDSVEVVINVYLMTSPNFDSPRLEGSLRWVKRTSELAGDGSRPSP